MSLRKAISLFLFALIPAIGLWAQIYAPAADSVFGATYNPTGGTDSVFIFNKPYFKADMQCSLRAVSVDGMTDWTFQWSVFDRSTMAYKTISPSTTGGLSEIDTISKSAGYRIEMTRGSERYVYRVWVVMNDLDLIITNKDADNKLSFGYYNCSSLDLRADTTRILLSYVNPDDFTIIAINPQYRIRWTTDNENTSNPSSRLITRVTDPPYEDTWYILTITDKFGLQRTDSVFYKSIQSHASMEVTYITLGDTVEYPGKHYGYFYGDEHSAPGKFSFDVSASKNMASYEIAFGDGAVFNSEGDTLIVVHEYEKPGTYTAVLTTKSAAPYACIDTLGQDSELLYADEDNFQMPNIFTPKNNGKNFIIPDEELSSNDIFRSEDISVLTIDITIFTRTGLVVHNYHGNIRDWDGWDGNLRHGGKATDGVYFYVITTLIAYEDPKKPVSKKFMKGFIHLYREQ
jgi:hypothetical protein